MKSRSDIFAGTDRTVQSPGDLSAVFKKLTPIGLSWECQINTKGHMMSRSKSGDAQAEPLVVKKTMRIQGLMSREDYWLEVQKIVRISQQLSAIFTSRIKCLNFNLDGLVLTYAINDNVDIDMYFDSEDIRSAPFVILAEGSYEPFESSLLFKLAAECSSFCDIGANVGFYTLGALAVNPDIKILSFEPNIAVANRLSKNLSLKDRSGRGSVEIFNTALGEGEESGRTLFIPEFTGSGGASLKDLHPDEGKASEILISVTTLDFVIRDEPFIDLLKIDVEGFELSVIKGGINVIREHKPTIFIELLRKWMAPFGSHPQDVLDLLMGLGYECFAIGDEKIQVVEIVDDLTIETNFIFCHPLRSSHMELMRESCKN